MLSKENFYNSIDCHDFVVMLSTIVLFVLTFAVFGLLLGFAAVYDTNSEGPMGEGATLRENISGNATQLSTSNSTSGADLEGE